jgi:hypothetical protein
LRGAQHTPWQGRIDSGPDWPEAKQRSGQALVTYSIRSSLASRSGSVDSFQVRVRWNEMPRSCSICRSRSRPIRSRPIPTGRPGPAKYPASLRRLHRVNGWTGFSGRVLAAVTMTSISPSLIRRGWPPARRGSSAARPLALNVWITSRTVSSSAATNRAIAGTSVPDADAMMIIARQTRTDPCFPRRTICSSRPPS